MHQPQLPIRDRVHPVRHPLPHTTGGLRWNVARRFRALREERGEFRIFSRVPTLSTPYLRAGEGCFPSYLSGHLSNLHRPGHGPAKGCPRQGAQCSVRQTSSQRIHRPQFNVVVTTGLGGVPTLVSSRAGPVAADSGPGSDPELQTAGIIPAPVGGFSSNL